MKKYCQRMRKHATDWGEKYLQNTFEIMEPYSKKK